MRPRFHSEPGPNREGEGSPVELVRVRRAQRIPRDEGFVVKGRSRRRGGRGRRRGRGAPQAPAKLGFFGWLKSLFAKRPGKETKRGGREASLGRQEERALADFQKAFGIRFHDPGQLKLALTHRSYLSVTGQGPRESNERLEFLGDSVLGLVTAEYLYRRHPNDHEGQLTKMKSLLVSKAILSRRALRMGLGKFVLMSHSEIESGGRQRLSILADAFESVLGAIYLDQGFETARTYIHDHLLADSEEIVADKRHVNYKSHLQEYVQSTYRTHPVYRIRSEYGPDHSKHFMVEVMVGRRTLGQGRGPNKKEAEQAAARDALEAVKQVRAEGGSAARRDAPERDERDDDARDEGGTTRRRRRRRGGRNRGAGEGVAEEQALLPAPVPAHEARPAAVQAEGDDEDDDDDDFDLDVFEPGSAGDVDESMILDDLPDEDDLETIEEEIEDADEDEVTDEDDDVIAYVPPPPAPAVVAPSPAPPQYGRTSRRSGRRAAPPLPAAAPQAAEPAEPGPAHEELLVDPYGLEPEAPAGAAADESQREAEEARRRERDEERAAEMERALESFGRRRDDPYGRKGRPARRGR